jgi:tetratricopeptide (TPR) repeat protein/DNA-binding winged helix-turn-helix (wHTH) protein
MNTQGQRVYRLESVEIDASRLSVQRDGVERHLRPQPFQVLIYLLEQRARLVSQNELMTHVWGETTVTSNALEQCLAEIRKVLGDDSRHPRFIRTVPRAGYRFIGKVEEVNADESVAKDVAQIEVNSRPVADAISKPSVWFSKRALAWAAIILVGVTVTTIYLIQRRRLQQRLLTEVTLPETAGKRSVAVIFFDNQSGSADLDWLREGLTDMLITGLSRSKNLTILSRQQLHTMLDRTGRRPSEKIPLDAALEIAQKSKATIVITGSFARLGEQIRIDAQLHSARDGQLLAAERVVLNQQEQVLTQVDVLAIKLSSHLGGDQSANSSLPSVMTNDLAAYRFYSLALERTQEMQNPEAIALLEKAIALDPNFAMAYARIGYTFVMSWARLEDGKPYLEKAFRLSERLSEKDKLNITAWYAVANQDYSLAIRPFQEIVARYPLDVEAYGRLGRLLRGENRLHEAIEVFKQGLVMDSEAKDLFNGLGGAYSELGRHDEAIAMFQRYVQLAPNEANAHDSLGMGYQWAGRYDEAVREYERALALKADFYISVIHLGNTRYQQGRYREALEQFQRYIEASPTFDERQRGYAAIAQVQWSRGRLAEAQRAARQALASDPPSLSAMMVTLEKVDLATAEKYEQIIERVRTKGRGTRGDLRMLLYAQGRIELKKGRAAEAIEKFKETLRYRAPIWNIDALEDCLADAYLELGRHDEAIAEYERILKLNPNYPLVHYRLAQAHELRGQRDQARSEYERFLQIWKDADADVPEIIKSRRALSIESSFR